MEWIALILDHPEAAFGAISLFLAYHIVKTFVTSTKSSIQQLTTAVVSITKVLEAHERRFKVIERKPVNEDDEVDEELRKLQNLPSIKYG
jgi:hypothetical protein